MTKYGMYCYGCREEIDVDMVNDDHARASRELENKAKAKGWGMGLVTSGEAFYSCPGCAPGLFNFHVFAGYPAQSLQHRERDQK